jgi:hypothetical protein
MVGSASEMENGTRRRGRGPCLGDNASIMVGLNASLPVALGPS